MFSMGNSQGGAGPSSLKTVIIPSSVTYIGQIIIIIVVVAIIVKAF
jgi:hypothetical protein